MIVAQLTKAVNTAVAPLDYSINLIAVYPLWMTSKENLTLDTIKQQSPSWTAVN